MKGTKNLFQYSKVGTFGNTKLRIKVFFSTHDGVHIIEGRRGPQSVLIATSEGISTILTIFKRRNILLNLYTSLPLLTFRPEDFRIFPA